MNFSVIIRVSNDDQNLRVLHDLLTMVMSGLAAFYEVVLVDDGAAANDGGCGSSSLSVGRS
jgi:hypothetical protein